jgi:hypothetical protein
MANSSCTGFTWIVTMSASIGFWLTGWIRRRDKFRNSRERKGELRTVLGTDICGHGGDQVQAGIPICSPAANFGIHWLWLLHAIA